jgi:hypothetical protein
MRVAVMGSGGLGGYFGALLVELGKPVDVNTPLNRAVADILSVHANGRSDQ